MLVLAIIVHMLKYAQMRLCPLWLQGGVSSFSLPLLAVLHHVQDMTSRHSAPTLPPPSFPHAGIFASSEEASWCRSSSVPGHTTSRDPRSCLLRTGCIRHNVPA